MVSRRRGLVTVGDLERWSVLQVRRGGQAPSGLMRLPVAEAYGSLSLVTQGMRVGWSRHAPSKESSEATGSHRSQGERPPRARRTLDRAAAGIGFGNAWRAEVGWYRLPPSATAWRRIVALFRAREVLSVTEVRNVQAMKQKGLRI